MSAFKFALGLGSILLGANHIRNGVRRFNEAGQARRASQLQGMLQGMSPQQRARFKQDLRGVASSAGPMKIHQVKTLEDRIKHIQGRIAKGKVDPQVYAFARRVVNQKCGDTWCIPEKDNLKEMEAIFKAVRQNVRYTSDILNIDTYQNPRRTLGLNGGDCDDYSSLVCSLLLSLGIPCRLKVIRTKDASEWNHIYAQGGLPRANPTRWYSLDASVGKPFGWEAPAGMVAESRIFSAG